MSWVTGTQTETLGANSAVGPALASFTTAVAASPVTGAAFLPNNFFLPSYGIGKSLLVKASGTVSVAAAATFAVGVTANAVLGTISPANLTSGTAGVLATTGLVAQTTDATQYWELEVLITCQTTGTAATFLANGNWKVYSTATTVQTTRCSSSSANPNTTSTLGTNVTAGTTAQWYIELAAACGTSATNNTFQCYSYIVLGLN
jgi:hypothetical protein